MSSGSHKTVKFVPYFADYTTIGLKDITFFQIFTRIKDSDEGHEDLIKASKIIKRIMKRDFYKTLQTIQATEGKNDIEKLLNFPKM